jgi:5'(3')-deoxyribonucleotidase
MKKLFLDMDGTLAKFNSKRNALERFDKEEGFFSSLKPFKYIDTINNLIKKGNVEVYIISASPNEQADRDKLVWLKTYLKEIKQTNICFCRIGTNKAKAIEEQLNIIINEDCYLLDDYTKNLIEWNNNKGIGIKRLTSLANNKSKTWKGLAIKDLRELEQLFV